MKVLIAYDGSDCAEAALNDLERAGLPEVGEALVLCAADVVSRVRQVVGLGVIAGHHLDDDSNEEIQHHRIDEAQSFADSAVGRLRKILPKWRITAKAVADPAETAIVDCAHAWKPDLIVVGSHGLVGFRRIALGSVSQHVLNHTHCSVRIGRRGARATGHSTRILVGTDGSRDATAALKMVAARKWPVGTEVRVVSIADSRSWLLTSAASLPETMCLPAVENELEDLATEAGQKAVEELTRAGVKATSRICEGNPAQILVAESEQWDADCIFVGARGLNAMGRLLLGSVSDHVALNAHCSVEVVRNQTE